MENSKVKSNINSEVIKEIIDGLASLSEKNQIYIVGIIKGMALSNDIEADKKGA